MSGAFVQQLAEAIGDCWWEVCEDRRRFATSGPDERATFVRMAQAALVAGRRGERSVELVAQALCDAFWAGAERPRAWSWLYERAREVFRICARRVLELAAETRRARRMAVPA